MKHLLASKTPGRGDQSIAGSLRLGARRLAEWVVLAIVFCGVVGSAAADQWNFTYIGGGGDTASGTLFTTPLTAGQATITGISGTYDGGSIIGLIPPGTCCSSPPNDNVLYYPAPYLDLPGLGFQTGSFTTNLYLDGSYLNLTAPISNVNDFTLLDSSGIFTVSGLLPVNIYADAFIPAATLPNPGCPFGVCLPGSGGYPTFAGDNRDISSTPGASFRIAQAITVDAGPGDLSPTISTQNNSGLTIGYDTSGNPHFAQAPTTGLSESATENANGVTVQINGSGSNPLVPLAILGPIVQQYTINLTPAPDDMIDYTVTGATKFFPGYELYIGCQLISGYNPASTGSGPASLLNPFPTNNVVAAGAISDAAADGCGPGITQNFPLEGFGGEFDDVPNGLWVDPASAASYEYTMLSDVAFLNSAFTEIAGFPSGVCSDFEVYVGGVDEGLFHPGDTFQFPAGTASFVVSGLDPLCNAQPFPLQLDFNTATASFDITPLTSAPEPNSMALLGSGLAALASLTVARRGEHLLKSQREKS